MKHVDSEIYCSSKLEYQINSLQWQTLVLDKIILIFPVSDCQDDILHVENDADSACRVLQSVTTGTASYQVLCLRISAVTRIQDPEVITVRAVHSDYDYRHPQLTLVYYLIYIKLDTITLIRYTKKGKQETQLESIIVRIYQTVDCC